MIANAKRLTLAQELNRISDEIRDCKEQIEVLKKFHELQPIYDKYKSLSGRKQEKFKKANSIDLDHACRDR